MDNNGLYTAYDGISDCNIVELINELFDDIGNCSNCRYYDKKSEDTDNLCIIQNIKHIPEWYCADFERKIK